MTKVLAALALVIAVIATPGHAAAATQTTDPCAVGTLDTSSGTCLDTIAFSGQPDSYTVPDGVTSVTVEMTGGYGGGSCSPSGAGGEYAGAAGAVNGTLAVTAGETLSVVVGGAGSNDPAPDCSNGLVSGDGAGGYNGGGSGATRFTGPPTGGVSSSAGGGGASTLASGDGTLRFVAAGGGGGGDESGTCCGAVGGAGGGAVGHAGASVGQSPAYGGGGGGTAVGPGAGGTAGPPGSTSGDINSSWTGQPGSPGTGPATGTAVSDGGAGAPACTWMTDNVAVSPKFASETGAGGGAGYYGGGGGGCGISGSGGGGGGSSYAAPGVGGVSYLNLANPPPSGALYAPQPNGVVVVSYGLQCAAPLSISVAKAERDKVSGLTTLTFHGTVNPIDQCGAPSLEIDNDGSAHADRTIDVTLDRVNNTAVTATAHLGAAQSCWLNGVLKLSQPEGPGTGTATREATHDVKTLPKPKFETATAHRKSDGVAVHVKVLALPPGAACGHATMKIDDQNIERLRNPHLSQDAGELVAHATRKPESSDCLKHITFTVDPPKGDGTARATRVPITGAKNVLAVCQKGS